jgi:hypothetical protein
MNHEPHCPLAIAEAARLAELAAEQARQEQERQAAAARAHQLAARRREAREAEAQRDGAHIGWVRTRTLAFALVTACSLVGSFSVVSPASKRRDAERYRVSRGL